MLLLSAAAAHCCWLLPNPSDLLGIPFRASNGRRSKICPSQKSPREMTGNGKGFLSLAKAVAIPRLQTNECLYKIGSFG
ncbi:hypothetical protein SLEP1_g55119 [Rubroshorea leprosula]|uniref:Secreted protein n=1 Tax=Rubroshorea leprosula TaxID=152421 RepID=A0AAV5MEG4_9ROSI|nr:hypothetical protein SLEP1_g55119 [Rubroshorea leprosula]